MTAFSGRLQLSKESADLAATLQAKLAAAIASLPPLPALQDLVTVTPSGDIFNGGGVKATISIAPAGEAYFEALIAKLDAFAASKAA